MKFDSFLKYLKDTRGMSENTMEAYRRDIQAFSRFLEGKGKEDPSGARETDIIEYLMALKEAGKSKSTVNRKLASIRSYYTFLERSGKIPSNPAENIHSPKISRKTISYLTVEEVEHLLEMPDDSVFGIRDQAILEVMYASGVRVSEMIELTLSDVNFQMGFVALSGQHGKARIVPLGIPARKALEKYVKTSRRALMAKGDPDDPNGPLFVNYLGEAFTRQGFWKVLRQYAEKAGLQDRLTPQTLRNSFALHMVKNGIDIRSLQELMGHEDITATQVYFEHSRGNIKQIYDRCHPRAKER